jgi:hypothetical protein
MFNVHVYDDVSYCIDRRLSNLKLGLNHLSPFFSSSDSLFMHVSGGYHNIFTITMKTVSILGTLMCVVASTSAFVAPRAIGNSMHRQHATIAPKVETQLHAST